MKKRIQPIVVLLLFAAPMLAAWVVFKYYPHMLSGMSRSNHGEFVYPVREAAVAGLVDWQGNPLPADRFADHWTMIYIDKPDCDSVCRSNLDKMRQVRLAQGPEMSRVKTLFVVSGDDDISHLSDYLKTHPNLIISRIKPENNADWLKLYTQNDNMSPVETRRVYFVDPLGQLMMYFDLNAESGEMEKTSGMRKDLKKLLHDSKIG